MKTFDKQKGVALILALFFLLILSVLGLSLITNTQMEQAASNSYSETVRATYAAQAGIERFRTYLLYDYKWDPQSWGNGLLYVPKGTAGALPGTGIGETDHDYFDLSNGGAISAPGEVPYDVLDTVPESENPSLFPEITDPTYMPPAGYQIMLRNIGSPGAFSFNEICVISIGYTGTRKNLFMDYAKGVNILENCFNGEDISIWNNIIFGEETTNSGGGNVSAHGNIHVLGVGISDPDDVSYVTKADVYNCYDDGSCGGQGELTAAGLNIYLNGPQAARETLGAKLRVRNGTVDLTTGNAWVGPGGSAPFEGAFVCEDCGNFGYEGSSRDKVNALEYAGYDIPAELFSLVRLPRVEDPYEDPVSGIVYPNYSTYLLGNDATADPGILGLKLATALGSNNTTTFDSGLAGQIWTAKNTIFSQNADSGTSASQKQLDPVDEADPLFSPILGSGKTFAIVASDSTEGVFVVYKEVAPFTQGGVDYRRQVHGMVFAAAGADMNAVSLNVDLDGSDLDGNGDYSNTLPVNESNELIRKVINSLWLASQKVCGPLSACYTHADAERTEFHDTLNWDALSDGTKTGKLKTTGHILNGYGVIQVTDIASLDDVTYNGRFTLFMDDSDGAGAAGDIGFADEIVSVPAYTKSSTWYAFPCQINMGILARNQITQGPSPHSHRVGSFYAGEITDVSKQLRILGAMVTADWNFAAGGNPDFHQAMEISRCLPPYMIGGEVIPLLKSVGFVER
ncbi:hypothetical protein L0156_21300 [bacterium]|nr:hypothetical protein [bacterium]